MTRALGAESTTDEVLGGIDLSGKRVLVTGVSAGLGVETARVLVAHGAHVVGTARDLAKAQRATRALPGGAANGGSLELIALDLASLKSVRACADALNASRQSFDVVIANAGVMACPFGRTAEGFETQFGTNHLGHFLLINRIAPLVRPGGRVVSLSSSAHHFSDVDLEDPNYERTRYVEFGAYGRSKTANILFAVELDRRHRGREVRATAVHPGGIATELMRHLTPQIVRQVMPAGAGPDSPPPRPNKTVPQGAATTVWAGFVARPDEVGGQYCEDCHVAEKTVDSASRHGVFAYALDPARAKALWAKSEEMVGEHF